MKLFTMTKQEAEYVEKNYPQEASHLTTVAASEYTIVVDGPEVVKEYIDEILNTEGPNKSVSQTSADED